MSSTDNAFIKAYAEDQAVALGKPPKKVVRHSGHRGGGGLNRRKAPAMSLAGIYDSAEMLNRTLSDTVARKGKHFESHETSLEPDVTQGTSDAHEVRESSSEIEIPTASQTLNRSAPSRVRVDTPWSVQLEVSPPYHERMAPDVIDDFNEVFEEPAASDSQAVAEPRERADLESNDVARETGPFNPQWEVDRLRWPAIVDRLTDDQAGPLGHIADALSAGAAGSNVIGVTSYSRGEGRTTLALCLARLAAQRGMSVVLLDGDLDNPQTAESLGISIELGWDETIDGKVELREAAIQSLQDGLCLLPLRDIESGRPKKPDPTATVAALSLQFDVVLVDLGPMYTAAGTWLERPGGSPIKRAILVKDVRTSSEQQLSDVVKRLVSRNIEVLGTVENFDSLEKDEQQ